MKILAPLFVADADASVVEAIDQLLAEGEGVIGLEETGPVDNVDEDGWLLTTTRRTLLVAGGDPDSWQIETLAPGDRWDYDASMARDAFRIGSRELFEGPLLGGTNLRRVFELASSPPTERIYLAAVAHQEEGELEEALVLFELARDRLEQLASHDSSAAPQLHQAVFQIARLHYELEQPEAVKQILEELTSMTPEDDLVELSESSGLDADRWWELLATSHRAAGDASSAATVYGILSESAEQANRHVLEHARALRDSGDIDRGLECYVDFLEASRPPGSFRFLERADQTSGTDEGQADPWLDVAREAASLADEHDRHDARFDLALEIIRLHPDRAVGYEHLFAVRGGLDDRQCALFDKSREILRLLDPQMFERLTGGSTEVQGPGGISELPALDERVDDEIHDQHIVHPEERVRTNAFNKMLGKYVSSEESSDARLHCEIIREDTYPVTFELTERIAELAGIEVPDVFISHQRAGIRALGQADDPFLLIAMAHLDEDSPRHLAPDELCFALATQIEHIRAGHLILTEAEYHQSLKKKGLQGVFAAVEMLPLGSLLAKTPISKIGEAIGSFKTSTQRKWLTSALDFAESKSGDAFGWATSKLRDRVADEDDPHSREALMKEQVAAFVLGAIFTADRMGLLACDSLTSATHSMLRLSQTAFKYIPEVERDGLLSLLEEHADDEPAHRELALRISELFDFALSEEFLDLRDAHRA